MLAQPMYHAAMHAPSQSLTCSALMLTACSASWVLSETGRLSTRMAAASGADSSWLHGDSASPGQETTLAERARAVQNRQPLPSFGIRPRGQSVACGHFKIQFQALQALPLSQPQFCQEPCAQQGYYECILHTLQAGDGSRAMACMQLQKWILGVQEKVPGMVGMLG